MILGIDASQANRQNRSGTEWYAFHLINEFKKLLGSRSDVKVVLYTRDELRPDLADSLPENFRVKILRWPPKHLWGQLRLSWEMFRNPPDLLFCPAHTIPLTCPEKTFTTLHDIGFEDYPELYDKLSLWYHKFAARLAIKKAFHIFTISEFSKQRIRDVFNYPEDKLTVTYLGIDKHMSIDKQLSKLEKYGLEDKNYILFLGRIEPKKNIANMIEAYKLSNTSMPLVLAGRKLLNIPDHSKIRILDYVPEEDKATLYTGANIFLFPTLYEGFGLPIIEAQSAGTPVITSNTASNAEIAGDGAVIVDPESPSDIAKAIAELISNSSLREAKIKAGLENAKRFDWQQTAKLTLDKILEIPQNL